MTTREPESRGTAMSATVVDRIFDKLDSMGEQISTVKIGISAVNGRLDVMDEKLNHTVSKSEMVGSISTALKEHQKSCKDDITGVITATMRPRKSQQQEESGAVRITVKDAPAMVRRLLLIALPIIGALLGYGGTSMIGN